MNIWMKLIFSVILEIVLFSFEGIEIVLSDVAQ